MGSTRAPAPASLSGVEALKQAAAQAAAKLVLDGQKVGLGTGTTVAHLLPALAARRLSIRCVATSPATEQAARALGLQMAELDELAPLDIAIDGADQIDPEGWLMKGGGGAHTREKIVAAAASRFVAIASAEKAVPELEPPVPLELLRFGAHTTLAALGQARLREAPPSPEGNLIADYFGPVEDPRALAARLSATPGVVGHGLFAPELVDDILIAGAGGVEHRTVDRGGSQ
ncbi:MAG: ribose 5-phosphate isomerase A [Solirubrobacteraceae bacterium]